jgi:N-methylhydantoinase A
MLRNFDHRGTSRQPVFLLAAVSLVDDEQSLSARFASAHQQRHGHGIPEHTEIVACRIRGVVEVGKPSLPQLRPPEPGRDLASDPAPVAIRQVYDFATSQLTPTPVYHRDELEAGAPLPGPAVITEGTSTTVVASNQQFEVDGSGLLRIWRAE